MQKEKDFHAQVFLASMLLVATVFTGAVSAQTAGAIEVKNEAFKEVADTKGAPAKPATKLVPATTVAPGEIVVYVLTVRNVSDKPVSDVVVASPISTDMIYIAESQNSHNAKFEISVDQGKSFGGFGVVQKTTADGGKSIAQVKDITHLRWTLLTPLKPKEETKITYRAQLQ